MSVTTTRGVRRRDVLTGGLAAGAGALLMTAGTPVAAVAAATAPAPPTGGGSTGAGGSRPVPTDLLGQALPTQLPGSRMVGIWGLSFYTYGFNPTDQATVLYANAKGAHTSGQGVRLHAPIVVPAGARLVRLDYYGFRDANGSQLWWLTRRDPSTFGFTDLTMDSASGTGAITTARTVNELVLPGYEYAVAAETGPGDPYVRGAVVQYLPPTGDFYPVAPKRVYDSRVSGGVLANGAERTISLATQLGTSTVVIPSGAKAAAINLTLDQTAGGGYLSVRPAGTVWDGTSSINWSSPNISLANGVTTLLGGDRQVTVRCGGIPGTATQFLVDVVGYYL